MYDKLMVGLSKIECKLSLSVSERGEVNNFQCSNLSNLSEFGFPVFYCNLKRKSN